MIDRNLSEPGFHADAGIRSGRWVHESGAEAPLLIRLRLASGHWGQNGASVAKTPAD